MEAETKVADVQAASNQAQDHGALSFTEIPGIEDEFFNLVVGSPSNPDIHPDHSADPNLLIAFDHIMKFIEGKGDLSEADKANYSDTRVRAAKAFASLVRSRSEIEDEIRHILRTGFPTEKHDPDYIPGLITQGPIRIYSLCPHHLLTVEYDCHVSYIPEPNGMVLGLSKLARIAKTLSRRPVLQEQLASDIADVLFWHKGQQVPGIRSKGSAVSLVGKHSCMSCRGVESEAMTSVAELRGVFWQPDMEMKFYQAINQIRLRLER